VCVCTTWSRLIFRSELSMGWVDPWVGSSWVEILAFWWVGLVVGKKISTNSWQTGACRVYKAMQVPAAYDSPLVFMAAACQRISCAVSSCTLGCGSGSVVGPKFSLCDGLGWINWTHGQL